MKKLIVVIAVNLMYALGSSAQNSNSGLIKLKPGEHISSENKSTKNPVSVNDETAQPQAEDYNNSDFQEYLKKANCEIASNDKSISELKSVLWGKDKNNFKKDIKLVSSLEKENQELKTDLDNYTKYGMGSWKEFQKEFNHDLLAVVSDLSTLDQMYLPGDLLSANSK